MKFEFLSTVFFAAFLEINAMNVPRIGTPGYGVYKQKVADFLSEMAIGHTQEIVKNKGTLNEISKIIIKDPNSNAGRKMTQMVDVEKAPDVGASLKAVSNIEKDTSKGNEKTDGAKDTEDFLKTEDLEEVAQKLENTDVGVAVNGKQVLLNILIDPRSIAAEIAFGNAKGQINLGDNGPDHNNYNVLNLERFADNLKILLSDGMVMVNGFNTINHAHEINILMNLKSPLIPTVQDVGNTENWKTEFQRTVEDLNTCLSYLKSIVNRIYARKMLIEAVFWADSPEGVSPSGNDIWNEINNRLTHNVMYIVKLDDNPITAAEMILRGDPGAQNVDPNDIGNIVEYIAAGDNGLDFGDGIFRTTAEAIQTGINEIADSGIVDKLLECSVTHVTEALTRDWINLAQYIARVTVQEILELPRVE